MNTQVKRDRQGIDARRPRARRLLSWLLTAVILVGMGFAVGWASHQVFGVPAADSLDAPAFTYVEVSEATVGSEQLLTAAGSWQTTPIALNQATGTITSVDITSGDEVTAGTVLYTVDLNPVIVAQGAIPSFGPIQRGDRGPQVEQLQQFLIDAGHLTGSADGRYGSATEAAVRAWQRGTNRTVTGSVAHGEIIWIERLPTRITLDPEIFGVGRTINAGEGELQSLADSPAITITLNEQQALSVTPGQEVTISGPEDVQWIGQVGPLTSNADTGALEAEVSAPDGTAVCADQCELINTSGITGLMAQVVEIPEQTGLAVPTSAIRTSPAGTTYVTTQDGDQVPVTVVQSARGITLVEGIDSGASVRVRATGTDG